MKRDDHGQTNAAGKRQAFISANRLCRQLLPKDFRQQTALIEQYQQFFKSMESDAVFQMVQVTHVSDQCLTLSVPNPALSNYLRLHTNEIQQMLLESFGKTLQLKISARPDMMSVKTAKKMQAATRFDEDVCQSINKAASSIEDIDLQKALQSLSRSVSKHKPST